MRRFDPQEVGWLERLVVVARTGPLPAAAFLARLHFSRAAGRGLILQPRGHFGYCYVRPARLAVPGAAQEERHALMALLLLLAWLRREGYLAVEYDDGDDPPPLLVVGEAFDAVRAERARVVLSAEGDFSRDPRQVLHANGDVAYEGIRLEGDAFALAHDWARGTLHASLALEELLALVHPPVPPAPVRVVAEPVPAKAAALREPKRWSPRRLLARAKTLGAEAGALVGVAHAAIWVLGFLTATLAGLHLGGAISPNVRAARAEHPHVVSVVPAPTPTLALAPMRQDPAPVQRPAPSPAVIPVAVAAPSAPVASAPATAAMGASSPAGILYGLDVSKWNGEWVDKLSGPLAGISFVFVRASDGLAADPAFGHHWSAVRSNGLVRGSYHFYRVDVDPEKQVQLYLRTLGGAPEEADITPVLDFEEDSFPNAAPPPKDKVQADLLRALQALERLGGRLPMIYTNWDTGTTWLDDARFARYPLWIADWTQRQSPRLPAVWAQQGFRFWQRTDHYQPPSQDKLAMDLDWFIGRREDLVR